MRRGLDRFVGQACRFLLGIFFRRIEVVGRDRLPARGPYVVVANHVNGLIDPMFVVGPLGVPARMLGKSTLWKIPVLRNLLDLAGAVPVYRPTDPGVDAAKNAETFARCHDELARGGRLALFPEGVSHDDPHLKPLKTGIARIVIEAERRHGPLGVAIVPVGLVFEERTRFRSRALVVVGEPLDPAAEVARAADDEAGAVRALTARVAAALERVTLNYDSWEEARLIELGADVWDRDRSDLPRRRRLASEFLLRRALADGFDQLQREHPAAVAAAVGAAREYERLLATAGVTDEQVAARWRLRPALSLATLTLARLLLASPVAALGTALNLVPWLLVDFVSRFVRHEPNQIATYKVFPALVLFPAAWLAEAFVVARHLGTGAGVAAGLLALPAGWIALRWHERRATLWAGTRAFLLLAGRRPVALELRARRILVEEEIDRLFERWRASQPDGGAGSRA
jgi:1-acyl-sn-glycerol-3-phosphate acyltransferase